MKNKKKFVIQNVTVEARRYRTAVRRVRGYLRGELTLTGQTIPPKDRKKVKPGV